MTNYRQRYSSSRSNTFKPRSVRRAEKKTKKNLIITIIIVIILGYLLLSWGIPALIGSLSVFNKLKPEDKKAAINISDEAIAPPILNIPFEATSSANLSISGYAAPDSKVEIYLNDELKDSISTLPDGSFSVSDIILSKGQNNIYGKTINGDRSSLPSKTIRIVFNNDKPKLEVSEPADGHEITGGDKKVTVSGNTDPDNLISINGQSTIVNSEGSFSLTISLNDGDNIISILATTPIGNINKVERRVKYSP